ncbi:MAG: hemophore-related protein, partial [[Mycobacterium] stephanolepidis]
FGMIPLNKVVLPCVGAALGACLVGLAPLAHADTLDTTSCSSEQIISSIQQNNPRVRTYLSNHPNAENKLRNDLNLLLAVPEGQRRQAIENLQQGMGRGPEAIDLGNLLMDSANGPVNNCHQY